MSLINHNKILHETLFLLNKSNEINIDEIKKHLNLNDHDIIYLIYRSELKQNKLIRWNKKNTKNIYITPKGKTYLKDNIFLEKGKKELLFKVESFTLITCTIFLFIFLILYIFGD